MKAAMALILGLFLCSAAWADADKVTAKGVLLKGEAAYDEGLKMQDLEGQALKVLKTKLEQDVTGYLNQSYKLPKKYDMSKKEFIMPKEKDAENLFDSPNMAKYSCKPRKKCSEMRSCDEAYFHLRTCKNKRLDRDKDGIPCESLCN